MNLLHAKSHQGKSEKLKHAEDVWALVSSIRNNTPVNHVLLKNRKRSADVNDFHVAALKERGGALSHLLMRMLTR